MSTKSDDRHVIDVATLAALNKAKTDGISTVFERHLEQGTRCAFGTSGVCCRICYMGPCRITKKAPRGACGATADTIVARNLLREVAAGAAAHSDHARHLVLLLKDVAEGRAEDHRIRDGEALLRCAVQYGIETQARSLSEIAGELADYFLAEFARLHGPLQTLVLAPTQQRKTWERVDVAPTGIDRGIVEALHRTNMGVDHDYRSLTKSVFRTALGDGWGGSRIASMASDILFGTPMPVRSRANLGVLQRDRVNVLVHGHEPELSEMLAVASREPEIISYAKRAGAAGVNLAGLCCTANEMLMRHGIPIAGSFLQQELAIVTGAVEMLLIDVQCCMPSLPDVAASFHTEVVSTNPLGRTEGTTYVPFERRCTLPAARALLMRAIDRFRHRDRDRVDIPTESRHMVGGFSVEAIKRMLGGAGRGTLKPLHDAIVHGRIRGVVGIVGCNNPRFSLDQYTNTLTRALVSRNVLVVKTGCAAIASAKAGMMAPEVAREVAGVGLRDICQAVGIPPVLHMGSCVDNSRILELATELLRDGGEFDDLAMLPIVGVAPEWMSEKALAIGAYFVASGIDVVLGHPPRINGSELVSSYLSRDVVEDFGASFHVCEDPALAADSIIALIEGRRDRLGINRASARLIPSRGECGTLAE